MGFTSNALTTATLTHRNDNNVMDGHDYKQGRPGTMNIPSDLWMSQVDQRVLQDLDQNRQQWQQPLQRYVSFPERPLFTTSHQPYYPPQEYHHTVPAMTLTNVFPHPRNDRMLSPAPSPNPSSSMSSSAYSPAVDFEDRFADSGYYSPQSQNDFLPTPDGYPPEDGFLNDYSIPQPEWSSKSHVNMSQVHANPDPLFPDVQDLEFSNDEVFMEMPAPEYKIEHTSVYNDHDLSLQKEVNHDNSVPQSFRQWKNEETIEVSTTNPSSLTDDEVSYFSDMDAEGEPEEDSIEVAPPARSPTPTTPAPIEEDSDEDETYKPRSTRTRKRRASNPITQPTTKRSRVVKPLHRQAKPSVPHVHQNGDILCTSCNRTDFKDKTALLRHIKTSHLRPYICVFHFAGCASTFASKNEWKRHVSTQHLCLHSWICTEGPCAKVYRPLIPGSSADGKSLGAEFNRKDLFTQHLKRMHAPPGLKLSTNKGIKSGREWDEHIKRLQESCRVVLRSAPDELGCCLEGCDDVFGGACAWDARMEHVGKHLDHSANQELEGGEKLVVDQSQDALLVEWAFKQGVIVRNGSSGYRFPREGELKGKASKRDVVA